MIDSWSDESRRNPATSTHSRLEGVHSILRSCMILGITAPMMACPLITDIFGGSDDSTSGPSTPPNVFEAEPDDVPPGVFTVQASLGAGSGFLVRHNDEVFGVTAFHVVPVDSEVTIIKEATEDRNRYRLPFFVDVAYVDSYKDIAILRFSKGFPVENLIGPPLELAALEHLETAQGMVSIWGAGQMAGLRSRLHKQEATITSDHIHVHTVDSFTGMPVTRTNPKGFVLSPSIDRGFSGGPVTQEIDGKQMVVGLTSSKSVDPQQAETHTVAVSAQEILQALEQASQTPRAQDMEITSGPNEGPNGIRQLCTASLTEIVQNVRNVGLAELTAQNPIPQGYDDLVQAFRFLSPTSRVSLLATGDTQEQLRVAFQGLYVETLSSILSSATQQRIAYDREPMCSSHLTERGPRCTDCSDAYLCAASATLDQAIVQGQMLGEMMNQLEGAFDPSRAAPVIHWLAANQIMQQFPQAAYTNGSGYQISLAAGSSSTMHRNGKEVMIYEFDIVDEAGKNPERKAVHLEYAQGQCGLVLDN